MGVTSTSKAKTIREFNHKSHYNQWQFIYDPTSDRGGLITTPYQPPLQGAIQNLQQTKPGTTGGPASSFGGMNQPTPQTPLQNAPTPTLPPDQNAPQQ